MDTANKSDSVQPDPTPPHVQPSRSYKSHKNYDRKSHGKRYPITQKIAIKAMQDSGMTVSDVARSAQTTRKQVYRVWNDPELKDLSPEVVTKTKNAMRSLFYKRGLEGLLAMTPDKYAQSSLLQIATATGIMTEKGRLMDNLSTENVNHRGVIEHISDEVSKLDARLQALDDVKE